MLRQRTTTLKEYPVPMDGTAIDDTAYGLTILGPGGSNPSTKPHYFNYCHRQSISVNFSGQVNSALFHPRGVGDLKKTSLEHST